MTATQKIDDERCELIGADLYAHSAGDSLSLLAQQRLDGHLENCTGCQQTQEALSVGLEAAQQWQSQEPDLQHLNQRLQPYIEAANGRNQFSTTLQPSVVWLGAIAAVILLAIGAGSWALVDGRTQPNADLQASAYDDLTLDFGENVAGLENPTNASPVVRAQPHSKLRWLSGLGWDGALRQSGSSFTVKMSRGFGVFSFTGGEGRSLSIATADGLVEVVGTRFYVQRRPGTGTQVGVASGKVLVTAGGSTQLLVAGDRITFLSGAKGFVVRSGDGNRPWEGDGAKNDLFLLGEHDWDASWWSQADARDVGAAAMHSFDEIAGDEAVERRDSSQQRGISDGRRNRRQTQNSRGEISADAMAAAMRSFDEAEALASGGDYRAALGRYHRIARSPAAAFVPYRGISRLEAARIVGFHLGRVAQGRRMLKRIVRVHDGEVRNQAQISLCELFLEPVGALGGGVENALGSDEDQGDSCAALSCLGKIMRDAQPLVAQEAGRIMRRKNLKEACASAESGGGE